MRKKQPLFVTHEVRRRLGTMLDVLYTHGEERLSYLHPLEMAIEEAHPIEPCELPPDVVTMDSTVELLDLDTGETEVFTLVYPERADAALNRISVLAPLGTAILGCRVGDTVTVKVPAGRRRIRVEDIHDEPVSAGSR